jgi:hypothetical protein
MKTIRQLVWMIALGLSGAAGMAEDASLAAVSQRAELRGYKLREVRWDPVLRQRWAVLESVGHPERPYLAELTEVSPTELAAELARSAAAGAPFRKPAEIVVHNGDRVTLWRAEENVRIQMAAVVQSNAGLGERVQLRVTGAGSNGDQGWLVNGIVRGAGSVEME